MTQGFDLIETLRWTRQDGFYLLDEHVARLEASAAELGFRLSAIDVYDALATVVANAKYDLLRVRLTLSRGGALATSSAATQLPAAGTVWRAAITPERFNSTDAFLRHKTTRRSLYEDTLLAAKLKWDADEVIFLNERDELCEGARSNLFLDNGEALLTPPLSSGLLPGVLRAHLLKSGRARESVLRLSDLFSGAALRMGNSVRGLVGAQVIAETSEGLILSDARL